ncbi:hypothetical protein ABZT26_21050 [Streptomyces sp. NPDC005395]|uniref:hypothetical protein n=1 Tax=unclassified Streptomyces TaxID=2593676 RepID=UPI001BAF0A69|nr:hypothetical protein [Streptomyces sp. V17-9]QUW91559.1 hypothetical protein KE639_02766 [Streptomyces sp. V17-9]
MGASAWDYYVPYQEDLGAALEELRHRVFVAGEYYWVHGDDWLPEEERRPLPSSLDELWADEATQHSGTHSILDVFHVQREDEEPEVCAVQPVTAAEARKATGAERLTREHVPTVQGLARERGCGRCAVLHDDHGTPQEIYFWGWSGD